jgi:hypothetical protein
MPLAAGCRSLKRPILAICAGETASVRRLRSSRGRSRSDRSRVELSRTDTAGSEKRIRIHFDREVEVDLNPFSQRTVRCSRRPVAKGFSVKYQLAIGCPKHRKHRKHRKYLHKPRDSSSCFTPTSYLYHDPLLPISRPSTGNCFLGFYETGKFKEPHKSGNCSKVSKWLVEYRGRSVVHLGQNLVAFLGSIFTPFLAFLRPPWSPVEWTFRRFGPIMIGLARPIFDPLLDRTFVRVFRHLEIRLCFLPHKKSSDVTLPIANKTAHPVRVRFLGK